ncbi:putative MscS Mechanosensitive ion channel [Planktothrix sp. PCC 11201]|uniref:mechanosensitive ion channel family protein n=1 Tax=Planktothrix sp. PCC 11201 TaxID=1729650 RepID=UPI000915FEE0|nr:mechanosensitive ion channel family protein [Planktothrix sp. PCC 11201]SKB12486.1 putative MscS Mechanosensitive ion channel [Planktothrix sp. PCC 11201]
MLKIRVFQKRPFYQFILGIGIALFSLILTWSIPPTLAQSDLPSDINPLTSIVRVGNLISAPVVIDGSEWFRVAMEIPADANEKNKGFSIKQRAKIIQNEIYGILDNQLYGGGLAQGFNYDALTVTSKTDKKGNTQIFVTDNGELQERAILTVTVADAEYNGYSLKIWSNKLTEIIKFGLQNSHKQRQPTYLYQAGLWSLGVLLFSALFSFGVYLLQKRLAEKKQTLKEQKPELNYYLESANNNPTELNDTAQLAEVETQVRNWRKKYNTNQFHRLVLKVIQGLILLLAVWKITDFFPQTRYFSYLITQGPEYILIVAIIVGIIIRISNLAIDSFLASIQEHHQNDNFTPIAIHRQELRFLTYSVVLKGMAKAIWIGIGFIVVLDSLEIPVTPVVAGLGIIGLALSFGSQNLIRDVLNGVFMLLEDHYAVGDFITVGDISGVVEYMNLRITQIRGKEGRLTTIPNGSINIVHNQTKDWSRIDFKVKVTYNSDINLASNIMRKVIGEMKNEPDWQDLILTPIVWDGVTDLTTSGVELNIAIQTRPGMQWNVANEFRRRLKLAFDYHKIEFLSLPYWS